MRLFDFFPKGFKVCLKREQIERVNGAKLGNPHKGTKWDSALGNVYV